MKHWQVDEKKIRKLMDNSDVSLQIAFIACGCFAADVWMWLGHKLVEDKIGVELSQKGGGDRQKGSGIQPPSSPRRLRLANQYKMVKVRPFTLRKGCSQVDSEQQL